MRKLSKRVVLTTLVIGIGPALMGGTTPDDAPAQATGAKEPPVLRTQQFESGELRLPDIDSVRLETFLRDLNHRRDYDYSQHDHQPGPDNAYLTRWINEVLNELFSRGYYVDSRGELHRPGPVVPTR